MSCNSVLNIFNKLIIIQSFQPRYYKFTSNLTQHDFSENNSVRLRDQKFNHNAALITFHEQDNEENLRGKIYSILYNKKAKKRQVKSESRKIINYQCYL